MSKDGGPAFPHIADVIDMTRDTMTTRQITSGGMTLRDYFAAAAMVGMQGNVGANSWTVEQFAAKSYAVADAMLKARDHG